MVAGIGVDCATIERIAKSMEKASFVQRVFSKEEQERLNVLLPQRKAESAAACFAAKEAFLKAAGVGLGGFALSEIAALRNKAGAPYYKLSGAAAAYVEENGLRLHLSLTHEDGLAIAFAVAEKG